MADTLAKILPLEYIQPHDPVPQRLLNASRWFAVEVLELDFGDYVGRPSKHAVIRVQLLTYLFANGWVVDAVQGGEEGGSWKSVGESDTSNEGITRGSTVGSTVSKTIGNSDTTGHQSSATRSQQSSTTRGHQNSRSDSSTTSHSSSSTQSNSSSSTNSGSNSSTTSHSSSSTSSSTSTKTHERGFSQSSAESNASSHSHASAGSTPWGDSAIARSNGSSTSHADGTSNGSTSTSTSTTTSQRGRTHGQQSSVTHGQQSSATHGQQSSVTHGQQSSRTNSSTSSNSSSSTLSNSSSSTRSNSSSSTHSSSRTTTTTNSQTDSQTVTAVIGKTSSEGPYWFAYVRIRLKRRKLQAELVMKDMVEDLTKAYNEGRKINDDRYDELVSLYSIMLGRSEDEANGFIVSTADFAPLTSYVLQTMKKSVADFHAVADNLPDDVFKNRVRQINLKFDNQLSTAKVQLITAGLFNSTVWTTTASGIERDREMALNDLIETKIDVYVKVSNAAGEMGQRFVDAAAKMQQMAHDRLIKPSELRNNVFKWMLEFMERRKDEFPALDTIVGTAKSLGYSETTTSNGVK